MAIADLTAERLREFLHYDPETGLLVWADGTPKAGLVAGQSHSAGYVQLRVAGKTCLAHRVAWTMTYGSIPSGLMIDHINGARSDNRLTNLRLVTQTGNNQNLRAAKSHNKSGVLGVSWAVRSKKWRARIVVNGKQTTIGYFSEIGQASDAYLDAKRRLHEACSI